MWPKTLISAEAKKFKTHGSESRGQEEAGRMQRMSELFRGSTAVNFVNTLNKPPLKLSLGYHGLSTFYHIELATQQWRKSVPIILSTSHCKFNGTRSCTHIRKTIPQAPIRSFTKQIVPSLYQQSSTWSWLIFMAWVFYSYPINALLPSIIFLCASFFSCFFLSFSSHTFFVGLREPAWTSLLFLCIHLFVQ